MSRSQQPQMINKTPPLNPHDTETGSKALDVPANTALETVHHLSGSRLYFVLGGLGLAIYLFALDFSVISTVCLLLSRNILATTDLVGRLYHILQYSSVLPRTSGGMEQLIHYVSALYSRCPGNCMPISPSNGPSSASSPFSS
jgi:hypothetical protein